MSYNQPWTRDRDLTSRPQHMHPRRRAAHESVSLKSASGLSRLGADGSCLSKDLLKAHRRPSGTSVQGNPPSNHSPVPQTQKQSSGESSNAERWFEASNNDVPQDTTSFADNDPPFFLRNSSSSQSSPDDPQHRNVQLRPISAPLPYETQLMRYGTQNSGSEDFRSVIDDLTVENKKLKKKLKTYEKFQDAHLANEKLFEVRVHDLPPDKKRELEDMLKKFAVGLGPSPEHGSSTGYENPPPGMFKAGSSMSSARFADSAYASASASGQTSAVGPAAPSGKESSHHDLKPSRAQNNASIQSYLHDIPAGLLPRQPVAMTEKARKRMVVRRLEQIFAGKISTGGHQHPQQQEEVAQQAATADRRAVEANGQSARREGLREAKIMERKDGEQEPVEGVDSERETVEHLKVPEHATEQAVGSSRSPDQRPTRPLDLDPNRAQVPSENFKYIRHLGFSPPNVESTEPQGDKHGWIYLNLIINMAQLHTINVTADFVKAAISDYSDKLELSHDGRRVRWRGGTSVTRNSSEASPDERYSEDVGNKSKRTKFGRKRIKLGPESSNSSQGFRKNDRRAQGKFAYTPLFYRKDSESDTFTSEAEQISSSTSPWAQPAGDSSGFTSSGMLTSTSRKRMHDGPIIFYNKARFCTDLSGERRIKQLQASNSVSYNSISSCPIGASAEPRISRPSGDQEGRGPLSQACEIGQPMDIDTDTNSSVSFKFSPKPTNLSRENSQEDQYGNFEVSGLGGVYPDDNFAIDVRCQQLNISDPDNTRTRQTSNAYPLKLRNVLDGRPPKGSKRSHSGIKNHILSTKHRRLPSSALPPPASAYMPYDSDSEDSDLESVAHSHVSVTSSTGREVAPQPLNHFFSESSGSETDTSDNEDEDGGSLIDLLATAREYDEEAVRLAEREYDANMADRLAEDIPAGSSAATAGGGSGFNSPASLRVEANGEKSAVGVSKPKNRKRSWTVESTKMRDVESGKE